MNSRELLKLGNVSLKELHTANPTLHDEVKRAAENDLRAKFITAVSSVSPELAQKIKEPAGASPEAWAKEIHAQAAAAKLDPGQRLQLEVSLADATRVAKEALTDDTRVKDLHVVRDGLSRAAVTALSSLAGLDESHAGNIAAAAAHPAAITDDVLARMVKEKALPDEHARRLGAVASLYDALDENVALVEAIAGQKVDLHSLAALDAGAWEKLLADHRVTPPQGTAAEYADVLAERFSTLFPTRALTARLVKPEANALEQHLTAVNVLFAANRDGVVSQPTESLNVDGLSPADAESARQAAHELGRLSRRYPGLELEKIIDDPKLTPTVKRERVLGRVEQVEAVLKQRPEAELLHLDLSLGNPQAAETVFSGTHIAPEDRPRVMSAVKGFQRAWALTGSAEKAIALLEAGYSSSTALGSRPFYEVEGKLGAEARIIYNDARLGMSNASLSAAALLDYWKGVEKTWPSMPPADDVDAMIKQLEGFASFFGSQSYCDCEHCQSVLGPAAYFVDLMHFVEENIRQKYFASKPNHALDLKTRRPDLWTLELSCENTNTLIPTLDVANPILENAIAQKRGFAGNLTDRPLVEKFVYDSVLPGLSDAFSQPFALGLERLEAYLSHFDESRASLLEAWGAGAALQAAADFRLSRREYELVTQPSTNVAFFNALYGVTFTAVGATFAPVDAQKLLGRTGLQRSELTELVASRFVNLGLANPVQVVASKSGANSVQNDVENVVGLTVEAVDRLHRFTRLQRRSGWTIGELDLVLTQLAETTLGPAGLENVALIKRLQSRLSLSVEEAVGLFGLLPTTKVRADKASLFDRAFNAKPFVPRDGNWPAAAYPFLHPALRIAGSGTAADPALARLLGGLRISDELLLELITALQAPLAMAVDAAAENGRRFALTDTNLALLYRHARLSERLGLKPAQLFQLFRFVPALAQNHVATLPDVAAVLEFHRWWKSSGYSLDRLGAATAGPVLEPDAFPKAVDIVAAIVADVAETNALDFAPTVFAVELSLTEAQSRAIVQANMARFIASPSGQSLRLAAGFNPTVALTVPGTVTLAEPMLRAVLLKYHPIELLPRRVGAQLRVDADKASALLKLTGLPLSGTPLDQALRGGPTAALDALVSALMPLSVAFAAPAFTAPVLDDIRGNPAVFSVANFNALKIANLRAFSIVPRVLGTPASQVEFSSDETPVTPQDLRVALTNWSAATGFAAAADAALARLLHTLVPTVAALRAQLPAAATAPQALLRLADSVRLAQYLGVTADTFALAASDDAGNQSKAADSVWAAIVSKYPDEKVRAEKIEPYDDRLRSRRRDGLADALIFSLGLGFESRRQLYYFYLIDVELEGCARTSKVVSAISAVQLYLHRVLLHLEQDQLPWVNPQHVAVSLDADSSAEWVWRKNYRVWEANRKVFLFPESYIEPGLRDDKTPLFKELEAELLQQDINEQTVLDAYSKYLRGFHELANLAIAGCYYDQAGDVLHLFGATAEDPPTYYYRTAENFELARTEEKRGVHWTHWKKINVQISSRRVAPVLVQGRMHLFWSDIKTQSINRVVDGNSTFSGYRHRMTVKYTALRLDGTWTTPQEVELSGGYYPFYDGKGIILEWLSSSGRPYFTNRVHSQPIDDYTLESPAWLELFVEPSLNGVSLVGRNFRLMGEVDLFKRKAGATTPWVNAPQSRNIPVITASNGALFKSLPTNWNLHTTGFAGLVLEEERINMHLLEAGSIDWFGVRAGLYNEQLAILQDNTSLTLVAGNVRNVVLQRGPDVLLLEGPSGAPGYALRRIGTTLAEEIQRLLFTRGVDGLLDIRTQLMLEEAPLPLTVWQNRIADLTKKDGLDFTGPYGVNYREIFMHIPALIANHLNSQGHYAAAQQWYHHLFDPTANHAFWLMTLPAIPIHEKDRVWQYSEFRGLGVPKLKDILTNPATLEVYRKDPFNPHAIARLRLSAYQKNVVMKYIDNLLDWGDQLFSQFTTESLNEATALYNLAADLLGPQPAQLGECGESSARTYEAIAPLLGSGSEILAELESYNLGTWYEKTWKTVNTAASESIYRLDGEVIRAANERVAVRRRRFESSESSREMGTVGDNTVEMPLEREGRFMGTAWNETVTRSWSAEGATALKSTGFKSLGLEKEPSMGIKFEKTIPSWHWSIIRQVTPVFCIPPNKDLLGYWSRVQDRLFKLHNCMDIMGVRRLPSLFAPEIDPRLLIKLKAAGLSLADVLNVTSGNLPPYRFTFLLEKARAYALTVQSFGSSLLSALEKKDLEELNRLRLVQQQHVNKLTTQLRKWDIQVAEETRDSVKGQRETAEYKRDQHQSLLDEDLSPWERTQQVAKHTASVLHGVGATLGLLGGVFKLFPQLGSPFAMKYGGMELGGGMKSFAGATITLANLSETLAASAALEATFERRRKDWTLLKDMADRDAKQLLKQEKAAEFRVDIARHSLELHEKGIEQLEELFEFYANRFSSFSLYTWLSTTLQRAYRTAWSNAVAMAGLAEQAFRFERGEEPPTTAGVGEWDSNYAGLLAGEQLLLDLQALERRYLETNTRTLEIDQPFSLSALSPASLAALREQGECEFDLPEYAFDLAYPGHYKRRIKAVRLTVPCVTGPYTNVSATLTLTRSWLRKEPQLGATQLVEEPVRRTVSVATSTAQNDAGVFELSFRDERYMPFEGAGAVSRWKLVLPKSFRPFDYQTITDAILSVSYTAVEDGALRGQVEQLSATLEGSILNALANVGAARLISLRSDFSSVFNRLLHSPVGTSVPIELSERLFPPFTRGQGRSLDVQSVSVVVKTAAGASVGALNLSVDNAAVTGFTADAKLGNLPSKAGPGALRTSFLGNHTLKVTAAGGLAPAAPAPGDTSALDEKKLLDVLLYVEFKVA